MLSPKIQLLSNFPEFAFKILCLKYYNVKKSYRALFQVKFILLFKEENVKTLTFINHFFLKNRSIKQNLPPLGESVDPGRCLKPATQEKEFLLF